MLNFSLTTVFILYVAATSKSSRFAVKLLLGLALILSKYIGHWKIAKTRRIKFPPLNFRATI